MRISVLPFQTSTWPLFVRDQESDVGSDLACSTMCQFRNPFCSLYYLEGTECYLGTFTHDTGGTLTPPKPHPFYRRDTFYGGGGRKLPF